MGNTWFMQLRYNFPKLSKSTIIRGRSSDYIPEAIIGEGSFGQVARCRNVATQELVAIKIIDKYQMKAGKSEIRVMDHLRQLDPDKNNLVKFNEHFCYKRSHCLSFEILDISLFDYIAGRCCKPLTLMEIRVITQQMLVALGALKSIGLVHGDIKPDNIMLVDRSSLNVKLIDFGLAFQTSQIKKGWLVQNPSYRAFEVMLGLSFNEGIDMWSLGCVLGFLHTGNHFWPYNEYGVMKRIIDLIGQPDNDLLSDGVYTENFFCLSQKKPPVWNFISFSEYLVLNQPEEHSWGVFFRGKSLENLQNWLKKPRDPLEVEDVQAFIDLLKKMFELDPQKRISPAEALGHNFITMKHLSGNPDSKYVIDAKNTIKTAKLQWEMEPPGDTSDDSSFTSSEETSESASSASCDSSWPCGAPATRNVIHMKPPIGSPTSKCHKGSGVSPRKGVRAFSRHKEPIASVEASLLALKKNVRFSNFYIDTLLKEMFPAFYTLPPNAVDTSATTSTSARPPPKRNIIHVKPLRATSPTASRRSAPEDLPGPFTGSVILKALALEKRIPPPPRAAKASVPKRAFPSRGDDSSSSSGSPRASSAPERWPANAAENQIESPTSIKAPKKSCSRIKNFFLRIFRFVMIALVYWAKESRSALDGVSAEPTETRTLDFFYLGGGFKENEPLFLKGDANPNPTA